MHISPRSSAYAAFSYFFGTQHDALDFFMFGSRTSGKLKKNKAERATKESEERLNWSNWTDWGYNQCVFSFSLCINSTYDGRNALMVKISNFPNKPKNLQLIAENVSLF